MTSNDWVVIQTRAKSFGTIASASSSSYLSGPDEFVGPFSSWTNVKTAYGAAGDGSTDDTTAIQNALNDLGTSQSGSTKPPVLYFPPGTYIINSGLTLSNVLGISLLGADPATTAIKCGASFTSNGTMLTLASVAQSRTSRITFEGNSKANIIIDQSSAASPPGGAPFDTGNEYSDLNIQNGTGSNSIGIRGGLHAGAAESAMMRCNFSTLSCGFVTYNFNALDWWAWYCTFNSVGNAFTNNISGASPSTAGAGHLYNCNINGGFLCNIANTGVFNFRECFQYNTPSTAWGILENSFSDQGAVTRIQGCTFYVGTSTGGISHIQGNMGPAIETDNFYITPPSYSSCTIEMFDNSPCDLLMVGNNYPTNASTVTSPNAGSNWSNPGGRTIVQNEVTNNSTTPSAPTLPAVLPNQGRTVFNVAAGASTSTIQAAITSAAALNGQSPIVHLAWGNYTLTSGLVIPPCDLQFVGDSPALSNGLGTVVNANGVDPAITLQGPSHVQLRDFALEASGVGILIQSADQVGARVFMHQMVATRGSSYNVFVDALNNARVVMQNCQLNETLVSPATTGIGLRVKGGASMNGAKVDIMAGAGGANYQTFQVDTGGDLAVRDFWYESNQNSTLSIVKDSANFLFEGGQFAIPQDGSNGAAVLCQSHTGNCTVLSSALTSWIDIDSGSSGNVWVCGCNFQNAYAGPPNQWSTRNSGSGSAFYNLNRQQPVSTGVNAPIADVGTPGSTFITNMLARSRGLHPVMSLGGISNTVTDVRIYRVSVDEGTSGIHITG